MANSVRSRRAGSRCTGIGPNRSRYRKSLEVSDDSQSY